ncbi:MAG: hypothetical protein FWD43_02770 [Coriobacteriia bacterium]|nr:hypothetical protein [Coriobacteriia bacterium]
MANTTYALDQAIELTKKAIERSSEDSSIAKPELISAFMEAMYDKIIELNKKG